MDKQVKNRIESYIKGLSDEEERSEMESLFMSGETNNILRNSIEKDFDRFMNEVPEPDTNIDHLLGKIYHDIKEKEIKEEHRPFQKILRIYMKVAALLLIPLIVAGGILFLNKLSGTTGTNETVNNTVYAPWGSRVSFALPDGSTGMLNSGSSISYSLPFKNDRQLNLTGEGWFEVEKDDEHPFIINALNSSIKALGTSFNISAYPEENYLEIILTSGKVEFQNEENPEKILILPSERLVLRNGQVSKSIIDTSKYNAWTEGKLVFRGDSMGEVARRIARWYNVDIELADKQLESYSFRGTFQDDKIEDILTFLAMTSPIDFEIIPSEMLPDGSFRKEKIIIYLLNGNQKE